MDRLAPSPRRTRTHDPTFSCVFGLAAPLALAVVLVCAGGCQVNRPVDRAVASRPTTSPAEQNQLAQAKDLFYQSVAGDRAALPRARRILEELGGGDSGDPKVIAYSGAARLLQAAHSLNVFEKAQLGREGIELEDRAVAAAPDDLEIRFLRGVTFYQLPAFLGRRRTAVSDLTYVARYAEAAAKAGRLDPRAAAADLVYYGKTREDAYDEAGAIAAWRAAVGLDPDGQAGRDAIKHLAEHRASPSTGPSSPGAIRAG